MRLMKDGYNKMMINPVPPFRSMTRKNQFHFQATNENQRMFTEMYKNALMVQRMAKRLEMIMVNGTVNAYHVGLQKHIAQKFLEKNQFKLWGLNSEIVNGKPEDRKFHHNVTVNKFEFRAMIMKEGNPKLEAERTYCTVKMIRTLQYSRLVYVA